ncbi:carbonyl reductase [NADPH] 3-like [Anticarsia gemmatalis]|uniref:carbonyl reductase [NADPH] 3-like n=1 Tax=Anticarsia gemmatalis TaxID=129554 RepID=UPI003F76371C
MTKVAVVTGSNKGIGFAIAKALLQNFNGAVYVTSRDDTRGKEAVKKLNELGLKPEYHQLDVTDKDSITKFRDHVKEKYGGIDILVNNAAVVTGSDSYEESKYVVDINYFSNLTVHDILYPIVRENGRILNISSDCGHLSNIRNEYWIKRLSSKDLTVDDVNEFVNWYLEETKNGTFDKENLADDGTIASYRIAKVALSAVTLVHQKELASRNISINSLHPGLVQTDMTHGVGFYSADQAAEAPLKVLLETPATLKGAYVWYDGKPVDWFDSKADYYFKIKTLDGKI